MAYVNPFCLNAQSEASTDIPVQPPQPPPIRDDTDDNLDKSSSVERLKQRIQCFTDGSALGNSKTSSAGWAFYIPQLKRIHSNSMIGTNNTAELTAIKKCLEFILAGKFFEQFENPSFAIYSDSEYSIKAIKGINRVKANSELIEECQRLLKIIEYPITFIHVKAHTGRSDFISRCNDVADKTARAKAEKRQLSRNSGKSQ